MTSKPLASTALLLGLNLAFFTMVSSTNVPCPPPPKSQSNHHGNHHKNPSTPTPVPVPSKRKCPIDALKLGICANLLGKLLHLVVGKPPKTTCCPLIKEFADLEAAVCLCTAIKANILGINLNIPLSFSLLLNHCGKRSVSSLFQCS